MRERGREGDQVYPTMDVGTVTREVSTLYFTNFPQNLKETDLSKIFMKWWRFGKYISPTSE